MVTWSVSVALAQNAIVLENQLPGTNDWDISGARDANIQGFATDISVNQGDTVHFKISSASNFGIKIYRLGYYQGNGARLVADLGTNFIGVVKAVPVPDPATGLVDCGGWSESATWTVPTNAVSGYYIAKLTRNDTGGASHIVFIVRNDASNSDLFFQASDTTWQAYNIFGGDSLYVGTTSYRSGHATKVSYNRPFLTRDGGGGSSSGECWLFNAEYPMIRWLEANGYDMTYTTGMDSDRRGNLILNHKVFLSVGHDEYWSAAQRANVQAARDAGVNLAFFSGNEIYWKTRWEADGSGTSNRTLVCYKEGTLGENVCGGECDPLTNVWTGLWRDGCPPAYPTNDGCAPENELSGQISWDGVTGTIKVPDTYKNLRFWRNTAIASLSAGQTATLAANTLGFEWDWQQYDTYYPPGRILLSSTVLDGRTHHLSLYRAPSGALVFGAGTVQWSWGLDGNHDRGGSTPDVNMQQATVNLLADMSVQPGSLQAGLVAATASSDTQPPGSIISSLANNSTIPSGNTVTISGTAVDAGGGVVAGVDVSVDGGATWNAATGTTNWTYDWTPTAQGAVTIESRAFDDSGNLEVPGGGESGNLVTVTVTAAGSPRNTIFQPTDALLNASLTDGQAIELGVKFRASVNGYVTGVRFYKGSLNTGTHVGDLWSSTGTLLAEATFTGETASGWQEVSFNSPVAIASNTTYIAAYHSPGYYADTTQYFTSAVTNGQLTALADGEDGPNGVFIYSPTPAFPSSSANMANYWVDVVFSTNLIQDLTLPMVVLTSPTAGATGVLIDSSLTATFSEAIDPSTVGGTTFELRDSSNTLVPATVDYNAGMRTATLIPSAALAYDTIYTVTLTGGANGIKNLAGNALPADDVWAFTTAPQSPTALTSSANPALPGTAVTFIALVSGAGAPTGTVQFKNNGVLLDTETLSSGSASSAPVSTLPHGNNVITAEYSGDANFLSSTGSLTQTIDTPPVAGMQYFTTVLNTPLNVSATTLASSNFDADGDPLTITTVSSTTVNGPTGNVTFANGTITYTPTNNYVGADQFTYTISDGYQGGTNLCTANVTVGLGNAPSVFNFVSGNSGTVSLSGYGIPGNQYDIQISSDLSNWSYLTTVTAAPSGVILYTDTTAGEGPRFYRFAVH